MIELLHFFPWFHVRWEWDFPTFSASSVTFLSCCKSRSPPPRPPARPVSCWCRHCHWLSDFWNWFRVWGRFVSFCSIGECTLSCSAGILAAALRSSLPGSGRARRPVLRLHSLNSLFGVSSTRFQRSWLYHRSMCDLRLGLPRLD